MRISRRSFLKDGARLTAGTIGTVAMLAGCKQVSVREPKPTGPYGRYDVGVQSYSFRNFSFLDAIEKTEELGLKFIEPFPGHWPTDAKPEQLTAIKEKLIACDVRPNAYGVCGFNQDEAKARKVFDFCKANGIGVITANPKKNSFDLLDKLVAEYNIKIAIHNHGPGSLWSKTDQIVDAIADHDPRIGVCLDTGHLMRSGDDPVLAVRKFGNRLHSLHLKDINDNNHDVVVGQGRMYLATFFQILKDTGFDGPLAMEFEINPDDPMPGLATSLETVRGLIAKVG